jgi:hypothetical protein
MSKRQSLQTVIIIAGIFLTSHASARAAEKCLAKPSGAPPSGQHWYYHHVNKQTCWYLREEGLPVSRHASETKAQHAQAQHTQAAPATATAQARPEAAPAQKANPQATAAAQPKPAEQAPAQAAAAKPAPDAPAETTSSADAAPSPWPAPQKPDFVWPDPPAMPPAAQSAAAGDTVPVPGGAGANATSDSPPTADSHRATDAADPTPPAPVRAAATPEKPAPQMAALSRAAEDDFAVTLFVLLFAGLVVAGSIYAVVRRRRRLRLEDDERPPIWARIVSSNAPVPRIRRREPDARTQAPQEQLAAPPLAPDDHNEQLARALQALADRLRAQPAAGAPAPDLAPEAVRKYVRPGAVPVPPPKWLAESFAAAEARRVYRGDAAME